MASCVGARLTWASGRAARPASGRRGQEGGWRRRKPAAGLHFRWLLTASRRAQPQCRSCSGKHRTCSAASSSKRKCQVSGTGDSRGLLPTLHPPISFQPPPSLAGMVPPNSPHFRPQTLIFLLPLLHTPSLPQLPLSLLARLSQPTCPLPPGSLPQIARSLVLVGRALKSSLCGGQTLLYPLFHHHWSILGLHKTAVELMQGVSLLLSTHFYDSLRHGSLSL